MFFPPSDSIPKRFPVTYSFLLQQAQEETAQVQTTLVFVKGPVDLRRWETEDTKLARLLSCTLPDTVNPILLLRCQMPASRMSSFMTVTSTNRTHKINGFKTKPNPQTVTEAIWVIPYLSELYSTSSPHFPPKRAEMSTAVQLWEAAGMEGSSSWAYNGNHLHLCYDRTKFLIIFPYTPYKTGDFQCHARKGKTIAKDKCIQRRLKTKEYSILYFFL